MIDPVTKMALVAWIWTTCALFYAYVFFGLKEDDDV